MPDKKISQFNVSTSLNTSDLFTFVVNGTNKNVSFSNLKSSLGVTGTLNQVGAPLGVPVLEQNGDAYNIRNLESSKGMKFNVSAQNGIIGACNFTQSQTGESVIDNLNDDVYKFKTFKAGSNIGLSSTNESITISFTGGESTSKTVPVSTVDDFPDPVSGVINLEQDTDYLILNDITTSNRFSNQGINTIRAASSQLVNLSYSGAGTMFTCVNPSLKITNITVDCPNGTLFDTTAPSGFGIVQMVEANVQSCQNLGNMENNFITRFTNTAFESIAVDGLSFSGTNQNLVIDVGVTFLNGGSLIDLGTSTFRSISIEGGVIEESALGTFFLSGLPNSGNIIPGGLATVFNNKGFGSATPLNGISTNDNRWEFTNNNTIPDSISDALVYTQGNILETTISTTNTPVKVNASFNVEDTSRFSHDGTGRVTYTGEREARLPIDVTASAIAASGGDKQSTFYIAINSSIVSATGIQETINSGKAGSFSLIWQHQFQPNDYVEVWCENNQDTTNIIAQSATLRVN